MNTSFDVAATIKAIKFEWAKPVRAYINAGRMILELKKAVGHGKWENLFNPGGALVEEFRSSDVPRKLIKIAQDKRLTNPAILPVLPRAWTTTYLLATLKEEPFAEVQEAGLILPDVMGSEIKEFTKQGRSSRNVVKLLAALGEVRAAVDGKGEGSTGIEQAQHCIISGDHFSAYNDCIHITAPVGFDTSINFKIPAASLHRALSAIQEEDTSMRIRQIGGEDYLEIRGDATRVLLSGQHELQPELAELIGELG